MPDSATLFFTLSKTLGFLARPTNLLLVVGIFGLFLMPSRFARAGRRLAAISLISLAVIGYAPLGRILLVQLEQRFPAWDPAVGAPAGIIILGGPIDGRLSAGRKGPVVSDGGDRLTAGADLARRYPQARLIYSGGSADLFGQDAKEAPFARDLLLAIGVPAERIELEDRSRNTIENATFTKALANPKPGERWLLVTSAFHMPRSMGTFRKVGFPVDAYPTDWRTAGPEDMWAFSLSASNGLRRFDLAVREWTGLFVYWLTGRTSELFPGPLRGCDVAGARDACRP